MTDVTPTCSLCWEQIRPEQSTERHNGVVCHAECVERIAEEDYDSFITGEHK